MLRFVAICLVVGLYLVWPSFGVVSDSSVVAQSTYGSIGERFLMKPGPELVVQPSKSSMRKQGSNELFIPMLMVIF